MAAIVEVSVSDLWDLASTASCSQHAQQCYDGCRHWSPTQGLIGRLLTRLTLVSPASKQLRAWLWERALSLSNSHHHCEPTQFDICHSGKLGTLSRFQFHWTAKHEYTRKDRVLSLQKGRPQLSKVCQFLSALSVHKRLSSSCIWKAAKYVKACVSRLSLLAVVFPCRFTPSILLLCDTKFTEWLASHRR